MKFSKLWSVQGSSIQDFFLSKEQAAKQPLVHFQQRDVSLGSGSYDILPACVEPSDPRHPQNDPKYADVPKEQLPPGGESLACTVKRVVPHWKEQGGKGDVNMTWWCIWFCDVLCCYYFCFAYWGVFAEFGLVVERFVGVFALGCFGSCIV